MSLAIILDHAIPLDSSFGGFYSINGFQWRCSTLPSRASSTPATSTWLEKENSIIPTDQVSHIYMRVCVSVSDFSFKTKYNRVAASPCSLSLPLAGTCFIDIGSLHDSEYMVYTSNKSIFLSYYLQKRLFQNHIL